MAETEAKLTVKADEKTLKEFRRAVINKYGKLRGPLGEELVLAIQEHTKKLEKEIEENPE